MPKVTSLVPVPFREMGSIQLPLEAHHMSAQYKLQLLPSPCPPWPFYKVFKTAPETEIGPWMHVMDLILSSNWFWVALNGCAPKTCVSNMTLFGLVCYPKVDLHRLSEVGPTQKCAPKFFCLSFDWGVRRVGPELVIGHLTAYKFFIDLKKKKSFFCWRGREGLDSGSGSFDVFLISYPHVRSGPE